MKKVTIALDDELHRQIEIDAAKAGMAFSDYVAEVLKKSELGSQTGAGQGTELNEQLEALRRIWSGPMWDVSESGKMPTATQRNARR